MTTEEQRLSDENKVLRDLLKQCRDEISKTLDNNDLEINDLICLGVLAGQIDDALCGAPADLLEVV